MAARNISGSDAHFVNSNRCIAQKRQKIEIILTKLFVCIKKVDVSPEEVVIDHH